MSNQARKISSIREFVNKLNADDGFRAQFFEHPSDFFEQQTGIDLGEFKAEIDSHVAKLKTALPGTKFYLPGEMPADAAQILKDISPCIV